MNAYSSQNDKDFMSEKWPGSSLFLFWTDCSSEHSLAHVCGWPRSEANPERNFSDPLMTIKKQVKLVNDQSSCYYHKSYS